MKEQKIFEAALLENGHRTAKEQYKADRDRKEQEKETAFNNKAAEIIGAFDRLGVPNPTKYRVLYNIDGTVNQYYIDKKE